MYLELLYFCVMSWNIEMSMIVITDDVLYCITGYSSGLEYVLHTIYVELGAIIIVL